MIRKKKEKRMEPFIAVFNCHVNNAKARADAEIIAQFGQEVFDKKIAPYHKKGIMAIFNKKPNHVTAAWVAVCTAFVNENLITEAAT